jgi:hypothetical protein
VGSGLILLVIVAAWLAVLVPMALRTHESSTSLSSVDRFSDAMRVLSRRDAVARARARREADDDPLSAARTPTAATTTGTSGTTTSSAPAGASGSAGCAGARPP